MTTKTVSLKVETYIKLKAAILKELRLNNKTYTINDFIERLLNEHNHK